jgi:hypothetical protein
MGQKLSEYSLAVDLSRIRDLLRIPFRDTGHGGHLLGTTIGDGVGITAADGESPAGPDHFSVRDQEVAHCWRQEVDLREHEVRNRNHELNGNRANT